METTEYGRKGFVAERRRTDEDPDNGARTSRTVRSTDDGPGRAPRPGLETDPAAEADPERERRLRRARFLAELAEARELRKRVTPRRTRAAELHARVLRTFRY
jgi:hypothetical protein